MAITVDAVASANTGDTAPVGTTPISWDHTVGEGASILIIQETSAVDGGSLPPSITVTYGGTPLTMLSGSQSYGGTYFETSIWYLLNPPAGTAEVEITYGQGMYCLGSGSVSLFGVDTSTPFGTPATANGTSIDPAVTASGAVSGDIYLGQMNVGCAAYTESSPQTNLWNVQDVPADANYCCFSGDYIPGADSGAFAWTGSNGSVSGWAAVAVRVISAAAAAPTITAQPTSEYCGAGGTDTFSVTATDSDDGADITYQWYYGATQGVTCPPPSSFSAISGATSSSYTTGDLTASNNGDWYYVVCTNPYGSTTSNLVRSWITGLGSAGQGRGLGTSWPWRINLGPTPDKIARKVIDATNVADSAAIYPAFATYFFGESTPSGASATAAILEALDAVSLAVQTAVTLTAAITESADQPAGAVASGNAVTAAILEALDIVSASVSSGASSAAAILESADQVAGSASFGIAASGAILEGADQISAAAALTNAANAAITESLDSVSASASLGNALTAAILEALDTVAGSAAIGSAAAAAVLENPDIVSALASLSQAVSAAITEGRDTVAGSVQLATSATAALLEGPDAVSGVSSGAGSSLAAILESADIVAATASLSQALTAAIGEAADIVSGAAQSGSAASAAVLESADVVNATARLAVVLAATIAEGPDAPSIAASLSQSIASAVLEPADIVAAVAQLIVSAVGQIEESPDAIAATVVAGAQASCFAALIESGDIIAAVSGPTLISNPAYVVKQLPRTFTVSRPANWTVSQLPRSFTVGG